MLGGQTLAALHRQVGARVVVQTTPGQSKVLRIVGTATMPVMGIQLGAVHTSMGTSALVPAFIIPSAISNPNGVTPSGPSAILIRLRPGSGAPSVAQLHRMASQLTLPHNYGVFLLSVQRPAEIINYRSMGTIPVVLGLGLATGAMVALSLTLIASVRRRRHDLALLKTLGFKRRQLAAAVAWQASVTVAIGTIVGIPIGIVVGRALWDAFADQIDVVAQPFVPALAITAIGLGALVLANLVAAVPGRVAARTPTALLLRAD